MNPYLKQKNNENQNFIHKYLVKIFLAILILILIFINKDKLQKLNEANKDSIEQNKLSISFKKCYFPFNNPNIRIIHFIITRFLIEFGKSEEFNKNLYDKKYIINGIRLMEKYLFPSLDNQICKDYIWILMIGNKINITNVISLINFNHSFEMKILYKKEFKNYIRNITKGFDVLITTRIDYDDRIYYDAVNDVRKEISIKKPIILHGYNSGVFYFELKDKYYDYYDKNNIGTSSIFTSLIIILNMVNDTYTIYDIGNHRTIKKNLLLKYKSFGIKELNYEPAIFNTGGPKFVYVRQKYSHNFKNTTKNIAKLKEITFNLSLFYGK